MGEANPLLYRALCQDCVCRLRDCLYQCQCSAYISTVNMDAKVPYDTFRIHGVTFHKTESLKLLTFSQDVHI
jgi:hypothetical protein